MSRAALAEANAAWQLIDPPLKIYRRTDGVLGFRRDGGFGWRNRPPEPFRCQCGQAATVRMRGREGIRLIMRCESCACADESTGRARAS